MKYRLQPRINRLEQYKRDCNRKVAKIQFANSVINSPEKVIEYAGKLDRRAKWEIFLGATIASLAGFFYINKHYDEQDCEAKIKTGQINHAQKISNNPVQNTKSSIDDHVEKNNAELKKGIIDNFERNEIASYIQSQYERYTKSIGQPKHLSNETAAKYSNWIVKYANNYGVPVDNFLAILNHEHYFVNENGDLGNWKKVNGKMFLDKSEGLCQLGETTQRTIWNLMLKNNEQGLPAKLPDDLRKHPELAIRMSAFYFKHLINLNEGNVYKAIGCYNGGPGYSNPDYIKQVKEKEKRISSSDIFNNGLSYLKAKEVKETREIRAEKRM